MLQRPSFIATNKFVVVPKAVLCFATINRESTKIPDAAFLPKPAIDIWFGVSSIFVVRWKCPILGVVIPKEQG